jgi:hypothetical protein
MCEATPSTTSDDLHKTGLGIRQTAAAAGGSYHRIDAPKDQRALTELDKESVAALSGTCIEQMERDELIRAIKAAHVPWIRAADEPHMAMYNIDSLRRLVYLSRRICRNQGY